MLSISWSAGPPLPRGMQDNDGGILGNWLIVAGDSLYLWGGFSYDEPYTYADGYRLTRTGDSWSPLPPLPHPLAAAAAVTLGDSIYYFGGCDYDREAFYTATDRRGDCPGLGSQLWRISTGGLQRGQLEHWGASC